MTQTHLPFVSGKLLRDLGMETALYHANARHNEWAERALDAVLVYVAMHRDEEFMTEDVREFAYDVLAVPYPPHDRAWGSVVASAARKGLIERVRFAPVKAVSSHMANASVWRAVRP
ncbi:MAG: hypothetical protein EPN62_08670 [Candidimonas sp.]|nr:MAG: hypothetical protein EPN77_05905 [Candidimonas sp.]TAM23740.1 MAG: hypothetical protein EPN62_08670 [Candidimonas sp.]